MRWMWSAFLVASMLVGSAFLAGTGSAQAQATGVEDLAFNRIGILARENPAAALAEIDRVLQTLAASLKPDPRVIHDLNRLAADLLIAEGRHREAGILLERLGQFAARYRTVLQVDPVPIWRAAALAYEAADEPRKALIAYAAILQDQRESGLPGTAVAQTLGTMVDLAVRSGDPVQGEALRSAAAAALEQTTPDAAARGANEGFSRIEVFYATDRARTGDSYPAEFYGSDRGPLDYGVAEVTVPDGHVPGAIESPSIWHLEFGPSPAKHITLTSVEPMEKEGFFGNIQQRMSGRERKEVFVFIHGFNVSFESAAKRAAQLSYDMNYTGVPVLYSWPSRASTVGYFPDSAVIGVSARHLSAFLDDLVARSNATSINIVAHSMGNRALTEALELLSLRRGQTSDMPPPFDQVVFAAPDLDAGLFAAMVPTIRPLARRLTLYASENDWALAVSRKIHGDAPRAGQGGSDTLADPAIDSVDMSELGEDMLAHGYFADDSSAIVDLVALFWQNLPPSRRCGLTEVKGQGGLSVWRYASGACPDAALLAVIANLQQEGVATGREARTTMRRIISDTELERTIEPVVMRMLLP